MNISTNKLNDYVCITTRFIPVSMFELKKKMIVWVAFNVIFRFTLPFFFFFLSFNSYMLLSKLYFVFLLSFLSFFFSMLKNHSWKSIYTTTKYVYIILVLCHLNNKNSFDIFWKRFSLLLFNAQQENYILYLLSVSLVINFTFSHIIKKWFVYSRGPLM